MSQLAIYIDDQLAERLDKAVKASGKSKSKWVADAIKHLCRISGRKGFLTLLAAGRTMSEPMRF